jgi:hypothetical protein
MFYLGYVNLYVTLLLTLLISSNYLVFEGYMYIYIYYIWLRSRYYSWFHFMQHEQIKWFLYVIHVPSVRKPDLFCNNRCDTIPTLASCPAVTMCQNEQLIWQGLVGYLSYIVWLFLFLKKARLLRKVFAK